MSYIANIAQIASENPNFRTVIHTASKSQLVVMNIPAGGEIGSETHGHVEQTIFIQSGKGKSVLDGKENELGAGSVVIVTPGTEHNILNTDTDPLIIVTVYAPANHIDGRIHTTKAEADADEEDEAFGERNA